MNRGHPGYAVHSTSSRNASRISMRILQYRDAGGANDRYGCNSIFAATKRLPSISPSTTDIKSASSFAPRHPIHSIRRAPTRKDHGWPWRSRCDPLVSRRRRMQLLRIVQAYHPSKPNRYNHSMVADRRDVGCRKSTGTRGCCRTPGQSGMTQTRRCCFLMSRTCIKHGL